MWTSSENSSDEAVLDLLRERDSLGVSQLAEELAVTATAVRQRLSRLMAQGYVARHAEKAGRGRPSHRYRLTKDGYRKAGTTCPISLWPLGKRFAKSKTPRFAVSF